MKSSFLVEEPAALRLFLREGSALLTGQIASLVMSVGVAPPFPLHSTALYGPPQGGLLGLLGPWEVWLFLGKGKAWLPVFTWVLAGMLLCAAPGCSALSPQPGQPEGS